MVLLTRAQSSISSLSPQCTQPQSHWCITTMGTRSAPAESEGHLPCCSLTHHSSPERWILTLISSRATFPPPSPLLGAELSCHGRCVLPGPGFHSSLALPSQASTSWKGPEVPLLVPAKVSTDPAPGSTYCRGLKSRSQQRGCSLRGGAQAPTSHPTTLPCLSIPGPTLRLRLLPRPPTPSTGPSRQHPTPPRPTPPRPAPPASAAPSSIPGVPRENGPSGNMAVPR